jgi:predicted TIM-barrel fold metal-dependent hydrolase
MRIVAIEEHYASPNLLSTAGMDVSWMPPAQYDKLVDTDVRLEQMDAAGIDVQVLSFLAPAVQEAPPEVARTLNDTVYETVAAHPNRFAAFASLPVSTPDAAAAELERTVSQLGFVGTMINGTAGGRFLDHPDFHPIFETAARLDVPLYLHPGMPPQQVADVYYSGLRPELGLVLRTGGYGWHYETSLHALRLIVAGIFDRWPGLKIIIGHLGEGLPFHLGRIDDMFARHADRLAKPVSAYFRRNFWVTTSGYFFDGPFQLAREACGDDRIIFSVDYPFSDNKRATDWFQRLDLPAEIREQIAYGTAEALLGITTGEARPL